MTTVTRVAPVIFAAPVPQQSNVRSSDSGGDAQPTAMGWSATVCDRRPACERMVNTMKQTVFNLSFPQPFRLDLDIFETEIEILASRS